MQIEKKLQEMGIEIKAPAVPIGNFVSFKRAGNMVYLSGAGPTDGQTPLFTGVLGADVTIEEGYQAARLTAVNLLHNLKAAIGDLDNVVQIVKLLCFVRCTAEFASQPAVMNGASDLLIEVFGEKGRHARSAIGTNALPMNIPVEIEMIVEVK